MHAQGLQHPLGEAVGERSVVQHLDDAAQHVGGHGVRPPGPRLVAEREGGQPADRVGQGSPTFQRGQSGAPVHLVHRVLVQDGVAEARGVAEQVGNGDGPIGWHHLRDIGGPAHEHPRLGELGQDAGDRVAQPEAPLLHQLHHGHRGDRLGHREDPPQGVVGHGNRVLPVGQAGRGTEHHAAVAGNQHVGAHHVAVVHEGPGEVGHPPKAGGIQAYLGGMDVDRQHSHGHRVWCGIAGGAPVGVSPLRRSTRRRREPRRPPPSRGRGWR